MSLRLLAAAVDAVGRPRSPPPRRVRLCCDMIWGDRFTHHSVINAQDIAMGINAEIYSKSGGPKIGLLFQENL
jgi:hypothetical protein